MADAIEPKEESSPSLMSLPEDWPDQAADAVVNTVDKVRSVTTGPVVGASRLLAYAVLGVFPVLIVLVLGIIAAVRGLEIATGQTWAAHGILGLFFVSLGAFAWSKRP